MRHGCGVTGLGTVLSLLMCCAGCLCYTTTSHLYSCILVGCGTLRCCMPPHRKHMPDWKNKTKQRCLLCVQVELWKNNILLKTSILLLAQLLRLCTAPVDLTFPKPIAPLFSSLSIDSTNPSLLRALSSKRSNPVWMGQLIDIQINSRKTRWT